MNDFMQGLLAAVQQSSWIASVARQNANILQIDSYNYNVLVPQLAAAGTAQGVIQIQADSDFAIAYMSGAGVAGGAVLTNVLATIQIQDTGTGKTFFNQPTLFPLVMGSGGLPFYLPAPRVVAPQTSLTITITNLSGTTTDFYINFLGARIYYGPLAGQSGG